MEIKNIISKQSPNGLFLDIDNKESLFISSLIACNLKKDLLANTGEITKRFHDLFDFKDLTMSFFTIANIVKLFPDEINGKEIAKIMKKLGNMEEKEGGPYKDDKGQIEIGLNSIIFYLLSALEVEIPNLTELIEDHIRKNDFQSDYIKESLSIYLISQTYKGKEKEKLVKMIRERKNEDILDKILRTISLLYLDCENDTPERIDFVDSNIQQLNNSYSIIKNIKSTPELNFSFYHKMIEEKREIGKEKEAERQDKDMINKIIAKAEQEFSDFPEEFLNISLEQIVRTIKKNKDKQMSLMSYYTQKALGKNNIPENEIIELGLMNVFFWTAFIIYDDFWDEDEEAIPKLLPVANAFARKYICYFYSSINEKDWHIFFNSTMDNLDMANSWETSNCRAKIAGNKLIVPENIPDYADYSYKFFPSSGHILGPIIILIKSGYDLKSKEVDNFINYFKNYLVAMQINDDAHDWEEDIKRGHISTVVAMMLTEWKKRYPEENKIDLINDIKKLQEIFWFDTLPKSAEIALSFTKKSREELKKIALFEDYSYLERFIDMNESIAHKAIIEQKRSIEMLEEF
ncbi:MAG: hypothetical protein WCX74_02900 [Candidatus Paceibacterota bacterium]